MYLVCRLLLARLAPPHLHSLSYTTLFRSHALVFPLNLFLKCARRFPAGCLLAAGLRFHLRLFRSCLLLCQLLLGSYPLLSQLVLNRHLHRDRKSTRLNSSHRCISYAVFFLLVSPPPTFTLFPTRRSSDLTLWFFP